jgi:hypothetical protein
MNLDRALRRAITVVALLSGTIVALADPALGSLLPASPASGPRLASGHLATTGYWVVNRVGRVGSATATGAGDIASSAMAIIAGHAPVPPGAGGAGAQITERSGDVAADFALSQVGKPYIYGQMGPYAYDCSGLALASWKAAGVQLPRTAAEQYNAGPHIALSRVQPGDLVFWASNPADPATIYHVAISLGSDLTVQATETGQDVHVLDVWERGLVPLATRP